MEARIFKNPGDFKVSLEARLKQRARARGTLVDRTRMLFVFDRFLARITRRFADTVVLKGGLALELRLRRARATKDVDLRMAGSPEGLLPRLQEAGLLDLGDYLRFEVQIDDENPAIEDAIYEGTRFKATCKLAGRLYGGPFGVDIGFGDPILGPPGEVVGLDYLDFIAVAPPSVRLYPVETHIAEKLHAYTRPRVRENSRVKDLPDLALLAGVQPLAAARLRAALAQTFSFRDTHAIPTAIPAPPETWPAAYEHMARDNALPWATLDEVTEAVRRFLDPVLASDLALTWSPEAWQWSA